VTAKQLLQHCHKARLTGIDNAPDMLRQAAINLKKAVRSLSVVEGSATEHSAKQAVEGASATLSQRAA